MRVSPLNSPCRLCFKLSVDAGLALLAYLLAFYVRITVYIPLFRDVLPDEKFYGSEHRWVLLALSQIVALYAFGLYEFRHHPKPRLFTPLSAAVFVQSLFMISYYYVTQQFDFPRSVFLVYFVFNLLLLYCWHHFWIFLNRARGKLRVLIAGDPEKGAELAAEISSNPWLGMEAAGLVTHKRHDGDPGRIPVLGTLSDVPRIVTDEKIDEVILASGDGWQDRLIDALSLAGENVMISAVPSSFEILIAKTRHLRVKDTPLLEVVKTPMSLSTRVIKRIMDIAGAAVLLILTSPLTAVAAVAVGLTSRGPVLYIQKRAGLKGRWFSMYKFRSMVEDAEKETGVVLADEKDSRVTPVGRILRKTRIDELPQLFNVLGGTMSFIGPRPERPRLVRKFAREIPCYNERFKVKPGLTGLAQINGHYHTTAENKLRYDLMYIYNHSFKLDFFILLQTVKVVVTGKGT